MAVVSPIGVRLRRDRVAARGGLPATSGRAASQLIGRRPYGRGRGRSSPPTCARSAPDPRDRAGVPWALVSAVAFGVAAFLLGYVSQQRRLGRRPLGVAHGPGDLLHPARGRRGRKELSHASATAGASPARVRRRRRGHRRRHRPLGRSRSAASLDRRSPRARSSRSIAVVLSLPILHERLVPNQYAGIALVVAGLLVLGLG